MGYMERFKQYKSKLALLTAVLPVSSEPTPQKTLTGPEQGELRVFDAYQPSSPSQTSQTSCYIDAAQSNLFSPGSQHLEFPSHFPLPPMFRGISFPSPVVLS